MEPGAVRLAAAGDGAARCFDDWRETIRKWIAADRTRGRGRALVGGDGGGGLLEQRTVLHLQLLRKDQRACLMVQPDRMEFHFISQRWRKPGAAHDTDLAAKPTKTHGVQGGGARRC